MQPTSLLLLSLAALLLSLAALLLPSTMTAVLALPDIFLGTVDNCSPSRYTNYAAWLVESRACQKNGEDASALTLIGAYPISNAGCGLGNFTVGGYDNITFTGCTGPGGPYPTAVLEDGVQKLECAPVRRPKEDRVCESEFCTSQGREGLLKTVIRCR